MELRLFRYFFALTEELNFTRAAKRLEISQPTLSNQIRKLENKLNTVLFHRDANSVEMTEAGYILLSHVNKILLEVDQAKSAINGLNHNDYEEIKVGCSGNSLLFKPLLSFHKHYPNIKVSILDLKTEKTIEKILNSTIDIGVVYLPVYHEQIEFELLFSTDLYAMTSKYHDIDSDKGVNLKYISKYPLFFMPKNYLIRNTIDEYCTRSHIILNPTVESSDSHSLINMAIKNNGFTILPKFYTHSIYSDDLLTLKINEYFSPLNIGVIYRKGVYMSPVIKAFIEHIRQAYLTTD